MDILTIRKATPGISDKKIFVDSAGSSLMPSTVSEAIFNYHAQEMAHGGYRIMEQMQEESERFYVEVARLIQAKPENIAFAQSATDAYNKALDSIDWLKGDLILTTELDYASNHLHFMTLKQKVGVELALMPMTSDRSIDFDKMEEMLDKKLPKCVAITHIPTNAGTIQDVQKAGQLCQQFGIIYIVDACQSVGQMDVNVSDIQCDFLSVTGRKFMRGPRGSGFLYASDRILQTEMHPKSIDAWSATWQDISSYKIQGSAKRYENFERSYAIMHGLSAATKYINEIGIDAIASRNRLLAHQLRDGLSNLADVSILDEGTHLSSIITFRKGHLSQAHCKEYLTSKGVYFSIANRFSAVLDFDHKGVDWAVRFSPHYFNTEEEMDRLVSIVDVM